LRNPESRLPIYQFRLLSRAERVVRTVSSECDDDDAALAAIKPFSGLFPIEVWQGDRLVHRFEIRAG
jgi:hypothetical protein